MNVLVAYASKRGSTAEIAENVAATLRRAGLEVDCEVAGDVSRLDPYDAVVLGSAVYLKRWRGDARQFLRKHRKALEGMPFWVFSSGPTGDPAKDDAAWTEPARIVEKVEALGARGHVVFGGRVPSQPHGPFEKAMVEGVPPEYRDRRDWDEIRAWATAVAAELTAIKSA
ncbi:MAG: flavodoxin domain-containing protein [Solirubrobacterales bacterium]